MNTTGASYACVLFLLATHLLSSVLDPLTKLSLEVV